MKRIHKITIAFLAVFLCLAACSQKKSLKLDLDVQDVVKVTGQSQTTENPDDREPREFTLEETEKLVQALNGITLTETKNTNAKGWEYRFVLTLQDGTVKDISISGEKMQVNDKEYKMKGYEQESFQNLFE